MIKYYDILPIPSTTQDNVPLYTMKGYKENLRLKREKLFQKLYNQNQLYRRFIRS